MSGPVHSLLILAALLFSVGLAIIVTRRSAIMMLIGIELMLNASNINLVAFNRLHPDNFDGQMFAIFVILVAVCETAIGFAIVLSVYRYHKTSVPDEVSDLKG